MTPENFQGITKARLVASIEQLKNNKPPYENDEAYITKVCADAGLTSLPDFAAESYAAQHADKIIADLEKELEAVAENSTIREDIPIPVVDSVPVRVSMRQARLALLGADKLHIIEDTINSMTEPEKSIAKIEWEYAAEVRRDNPFVNGLTKALGMSEDQVDTLFIIASKL